MSLGCVPAGWTTGTEENCSPSLGSSAVEREDTNQLKILKYEADRVPVMLFFAFTTVDFIVYFTVDQFLIIALYFLSMVPVKALIGAWNHHHQHVAMFHAKPLNRLLELVFALHTGVSTNAWTLHHVHGHHKNYLDQEKDEARWRDRSGEPIAYIPFALVTSATAYTRAYKVGRDHPRLQRAFVGYGLLTLLLIVALVAFKPVNGLFLFVLAPVISLVITVAATHDHHSDLDTDDHMEASHNNLGRWYNIFTGNLGYHTAHHYRQGVHWSNLPILHQQLKDKIPAELIVNDSQVIDLENQNTAVK